MTIELSQRKNVLGTPLKLCCNKPVTGFFRDGYCRTSNIDTGKHIVCALINDRFLSFTKQQGNDLSTPRIHLDFSGLKPGDRWCLCVSRWKEALENNSAPKIFLEACDESVLKYISIDLSCF